MLGLALLLFACFLPHLISKVLLGHSPWPRRFLRAAARICGARIAVHGDPLEPHTLILANHISWLDILVLGSATGCAFVSKDSLGHPLAHWLADQHHTIYVDRSARRKSGDQIAAIRQALGRCQPLAIFPEGTVGPGDQLLPFRSTLLAAVAPAPSETSVRPVAIDFGTAAADLSWHGEDAIPNVLRILGRRGTFPVAVRLLDPLAPSANRKHLATLARDRISAALGASSSPPARL